MQYNQPDDILDIIKDIDSRLTAVETGANSQRTAIDDGALEVRQAGVTKVKVGKLEDGTYGINMYDASGNPLSISQLAFGLTGQGSDSAISPTPLNAWQDDPAISQTVTVKNGRMIVIVSAQVNSGDGGAGTPTDAYFGYRASGASVIAPSKGASVYARFDGTGMQRTIQASYVDLKTGIANGTYTVVPTLYAGSTGSPSNGSSFAFRRLIILPY
jgi:hypothetical protein